LDEIMPSLMPTMPYSSASATVPDSTDVTAVEIGGETEFGVVGHLDRLVIGLEPVERHHPKVSSLVMTMSLLISAPSA
jgi:hypothetical protein